MKKKKAWKKEKKQRRMGEDTLAALEIYMVAIQLALCMQFGTLCTQLSHFYSAPKLLEKTSFKLEPQYECSVLPRIFLRSGGAWGRH